MADLAGSMPNAPLRSATTPLLSPHSSRPSTSDVSERSPRGLNVDTNPNRREAHSGSPADRDRQGRAWASTVERDPWNKIILACDGGGIRGYSSLLILKEIFRAVARWETRLDEEELGSNSRLWKEEDLLPAHYFDFMYGTSTGGLIATMLGRLRMSIGQCLEIYRDVGESLFGHKRSVIPFTTKYHHKPLETAVQDIVRRYCKVHEACTGEDSHPWEVDPLWQARGGLSEPICQSISLTATHDNRTSEAYLLRSYNHVYPEDMFSYITRYNEGADSLKIWEVTRATSAAPFYFKALEADIKGEIKLFKDGGIRENNPAGAAWSEFMSQQEDEDARPGLLLSIGTGVTNASQDGFASSWPGPFGQSTMVKKITENMALIRHLLIKYTDGEKQHTDLRAYSAKGEHRWYKRLNVSSGLEGMKLDEWLQGPWRDFHAPEDTPMATVPGGISLMKMQDATRHYLSRERNKDIDDYAAPKDKVEHIAEKLVRTRRAREKSAQEGPEARERWDRYMGRYLTKQRVEAADEVRRPNS